MSPSLAKSHSDAMLEIRDKYIADGQPWPATASDLAAWAIRKGEWNPQPELLLKVCCREFADAMRNEHHVDPQGRTVRTSHCARVTVKDDEGNRQQLALWDKMGTADHAHMVKSFMQRRNQIVGDCRSLNSDGESYNGNHLPEGFEEIQISFDFTDDLVSGDLVDDGDEESGGPRVPR